jgi:hypothetical protein
MEWTVVLAGPARKALKRIPAADRTRILAVLGEMQQDPFHGDIRKLQGLAGFRRRTGNWQGDRADLRALRRQRGYRRPQRGVGRKRRR